MKQRLLFMILAVFTQVMSYAAIVLDDPVIEQTYMKFSGQCAEHNWKFVLDTYEWADRGPQFQLTITPMDVAQDAGFTSEDLADENYWEPMFRRYTKQMAGSEMEAYNNIKKIFITNVRLVEGQFKGYATDALNVLEINASGNYTIPNQCFGSLTDSESLKLKQFNCNVDGTLTIGSNVFPTNSGSMTIYTTKETLAQQWYDYKTSNGHGYTVYLNGTQYNGGGSSGGAAIVLDEPVIGNDYMKFSGQCAEHNWKFVLDTYEWADKGPQFQLTITPMDILSDAYFTSDDLADENYWEPLFRKYTKQLAKEEIEACESIKKIFITDVRLSEGQFRGYATDALNVLEINATGDYTIPADCFGTSSTSTTTNSLKLKQFYCNVNGTLTIGTDVFPTNSGSMTIYTTKETLAQQWYDYKTSNGHGYTVYLNGTQYNGGGSSGGTSSTDVITNMKLTIKHNGGDAFTQEFPASGFDTVDLTNEITSSLIINKVEAAAPDDITEVKFVATMYNSGFSPSDDEWREIPLTKQDDGTWVMEGQYELVENESKDKTKIFEFYLKATDSQGNSVYYNNGGQNYKVTYKIGGGESSDWKIKVYSENTAELGLKIDGEDWSTSYTGNAIRERYYGWNPGEVSSIKIDNFSLSFIRNDDVSIDNVKLKYRVYEADATGGDWSSITASSYSYGDVYNKDKDVTEHYMTFNASDLSQDVTSGLESGKGYVLELYYKVTTTDGNTIDFGKDKDGMKFYFSIAESSEVILGDANGDGKVTMSDANLVVNYFLATDKSTININVEAANVNGDTNTDGTPSITMADANQIVNMFLSGAQ